MADVSYSAAKVVFDALMAECYEDLDAFLSWHGISPDDFDAAIEFLGAAVESLKSEEQ